MNVFAIVSSGVKYSVRWLINDTVAYLYLPANANYCQTRENDNVVETIVNDQIRLFLSRNK